MINALWLIPAILVGAVIGMVMTCLAVSAHDRDKIGG